jgi:hypothetical protein
MYFIWFPEQTTVIHLNSINGFVLVCNGEIVCFKWGSNRIFKYYLDEIKTLNSYVCKMFATDSSILPLFQVSAFKKEIRLCRVAVV